MDRPLEIELAVGSKLHGDVHQCFCVPFHSAMSISRLHCKNQQLSKIVSAISFRLHLCLRSPTVARRRRRQDTWAQISRLGWPWKRTPKIQEFFPFPVSQHYNVNLLPPAKGLTSALFPQMSGHLSFMLGWDRVSFIALCERTWCQTWQLMTAAGDALTSAFGFMRRYRRKHYLPCVWW